jgi:hypothetical protein
MSLRWQLQANEHHVVVQLCTEFRTWLREDGAITNHGQTNMSLRNQPVKADQEQTMSELRSVL